MKNFNRNLKAISPIFATLLLIAISVIAGVVVYMFTSGVLAVSTSGGAAAQEKITVQSASISSGHTTVTLHVQTTGGPTPVVNSIIIKDSAGNTVATVSVIVTNPVPTPSPAGTLSRGILYTITGSTTALPSETYTATLVTNAGGSFVSPTFIVP